ncbi:unnamed protein product [Caenorhabditis angaria]|uniref:Protein quiver n=1 Tax=Caenorhabditis angaria TaxID=860376 RepID=A0A9P1IVJ9_9PELO|nr:unnamed protein product [Caenorhabditis angaria]
MIMLLRFCFLPIMTFGLMCINSTSYKDRLLIAPKSSVCASDWSLCMKTVQISTSENGLPEVLSIHRECYELKPITITNDCIDSYVGNEPRRTGPHLITCYCSSNLCNF